jgi:DNA-binding NtrC family response regulator
VPWAERRRSGELPLSFLARVERLLLAIPPLRDRPEDIEAQARWITRVVSAEVGADIELGDDAIEGLKSQSFAESNSRELRNAIERAVVRHNREVDILTWEQIRPFLGPTDSPARTPTASPRQPFAPTNLNDWQRRVRSLASKLLSRGLKLEPSEADAMMNALFDEMMPTLWPPTETARARSHGDPPIPWPLWEDVWRCFAIGQLGGPTPAERALGIPANTLRQWISDHESR